MNWQILRNKALNQAKFSCSRCGSNRNLHGHHKRYPAQRIEDIQILCVHCHSWLHFGKNSIKWNKSRLKRYCEEGKSLREIGAIFNTSHERIRQKLIIFRLSTKPKSKLRPRPKQIILNKIELRELCEQGKTLKEIGNIYNVSPSTIRCRLLQFNLRIHKSILNEPHWISLTEKDYQILKNKAKNLALATFVRIIIRQYLEKIRFNER